MLQIGETLISLDILEKQFICNLGKCKGACCIEGESGAPLLQEEVLEIEAVLDIIWDDLAPKAKEIIEKQGVAYVDAEGDLVTSIINGKACVFTYFEDDGTCKCAIEKAYNNGNSAFRKPSSCYLYPIRLKQYKHFMAVNYDTWDICKPALALGKQNGTPLYQFLKTPLIEKFGQDWYDELCLAAEAMKDHNSKK